MVWKWRNIIKWTLSYDPAMPHIKMSLIRTQGYFQLLSSIRRRVQKSWGHEGWISSVIDVVNVIKEEFLVHWPPGHLQRPTWTSVILHFLPKCISRHDGVWYVKGSYWIPVIVGAKMILQQRFVMDPYLACAATSLMFIKPQIKQQLVGTNYLSIGTWPGFRGPPCISYYQIKESLAPQFEAGWTAFHCSQKEMITKRRDETGKASDEL